MKSFFKELKRRRVYRVALAYGIFASAMIQVGGTIAGVGQRMLQGTAKMMASQFFTALEAEAKTSEGEGPPKHGFFRTTLRWFSGWLKSVFLKRKKL